MRSSSSAKVLPSTPTSSSHGEAPPQRRQSPKLKPTLRRRFLGPRLDLLCSRIPSCPPCCALSHYVKLPIVHPASKFRMYWDALIFCAVFYNCNATPILLATPPRDRLTVRKLGAIDTAIDVLFLIDTMTGFVYGFVDKDTKQVVMDQKAITDQYLYSWRFKINLMAISPLVSLPRGTWPGVCRLAFTRDGTKHRRISRLFCFQVGKLIRVLRMLLINTQLAAVRDVLEFYKIVKLNEPMYRMVQIMCYLIFSLSVWGSFYFWLACNNVKSEHTPWCSYGLTPHAQNDKWVNGTLVTGRKRGASEVKTWVENDVVFQAGSHTWSDVLARILHFMAQTFFTIGYGDSVAPVSVVEIRYMICIMLVGAFSYALVIANMTSVLSNSNVLQKRHDDEMATITNFIRNQDLPDALRARVKGVLEYLWNKQSGMSDQQLISKIPVKLRELASAQQIRTVVRLPYFAPRNRGNSDEFAQKIALALDTRLYLPKSTVFWAHEKSREMVIVRVGTLLVLSMTSATPLDELAAGDYIGDFQLILDVKHPVTVKCANAFTEIFALTYPVFKKCCDECHVVVEETCKGLDQMTDQYQNRLSKWLEKRNAIARTENKGDGGGPAAAGTLDEKPEMWKRTSMLRARPSWQSFRDSFETDSSDDDNNDDAAAAAAATAASSVATATVRGNNTLAVADEDDEDDETRRRKILPDSWVHGYWEPLLICLVLYQNAMYPLRVLLYTGAWNARFRSNGHCFVKDPTLFFDLLVDCVFIAEVVLRGHYFAYQDIVSRKIVVIADTASIRARYRHSFRFKVDCVTSVPWILLAPAFAPTSKLGCMCYAATRFPHQLRCLNLAEYVYDYRQYLQQKLDVELSEKFVICARRAYETFSILVAMASFWAVLRGFGDGGTKKAFNARFSEALYFAIVTFSTVGYGDITPETTSETWFCVFGSIFGPMCFAGIVANVTGFIHSTNMSEDNILHKRAVLATFLAEREVSAETQKRVDAFFQYVEQEKGGVDELKLVRTHLPSNIAEDILLYLTHRLVLSCKLFHGTEGGFLREVMVRLQQRFYMSREFVALQGRQVEGMFFVAAGECDVIIDGDKVNTLSTNGFFAEDGLLDPKNSLPYSVQCVSYNEQWFLSRNAFEAILPAYPMVAKRRGEMEKRVRRYKHTSNSSSSSSTQDAHHLRATKKAGLRDVARRGSSAIQEQMQRRFSEFVPADMIAPNGLFMKCWRFVLLFFNSWNLFFIPVRAVFMAGYTFRSTMILMMVFDYVGDLVFVVDAVIEARFLPYYQGEFLVKARHKILRRYLKSWTCRIHVLASLPFDFFYFTGRAGGGGAMRSLNLSPVQYLNVCRVNKLLRCAFLGDHWSHCERSLQAWGLRPHKNALRMTRLVLAMVFASHVFGCVFFFIAVQRGNLGQCDKYEDPSTLRSCANWASNNNLLNVAWHDVRFDDVLGVLGGGGGSTTRFQVWGAKYAARDVASDLEKNRLFWRQYVTSLYWGFATITTVGYGDIHSSSLSEMQFNVVCLFMSVSMYTIIIANMEDIVAQLDVTLTLYSMKREKVKKYCMRSFLPDAMQISINDYYDKLWTQQKGVSGTEVLNMLPANLRARVVHELTGSMVRDMFFVETRCGAFVDELACTLQLDLFMPHNFLFRMGECAWQIFFIFFGQVQLVDELTGQVYSSLERAVLGEAEFFSRVLYPVSAETTDYSQIFTLHFCAFEALLRRYRCVTEFRDYVVDHYADLAKLELGKLKATTIPNLKHPKIAKMFAGAVEATDAAHAAASSSYFPPLIDPSSFPKRVWMVLCLSGALYFLISVPYEIAYARHFRREVFIADIFYLALYIGDIGLNLTRFMVKKQGKLITDPEHFREIYIKTYLFNDLLGLMPASTIAALALPAHQRFDTRHYSVLLNVLRLFQVLRVQQIDLYFVSFNEFVEDFLQVHPDSDIIFLVMIYIIILLICHWMAAIYYTLGRYELYQAGGGNVDWFKDDARGCAEYNAGRAAPNIWICQDANIYDGPSLQRWLYSFYWSIYTCMTIGYGALTVSSNAEKLLCSFGMLVGAVVCDAGVTASLTSYIEHMDHQHGTNKRRVVCCQEMLRSAEVAEPMIDRVDAFFKYVDGELENLDEAAILMELNSALRNSILHRAAQTKLCDSLMYGGFEAGIVATMVYEMRIVVAVPLERILQIGQPDPSLFIFQSGVAHSVDGCGDEEFIATGTILSNVEFKQVAKRVGVPTKQLEIDILEARNLPAQTSMASAVLAGKSRCNPYVALVIVSKTVFGSSTKTCQTQVCKYTTSPSYDEHFKVKAYQNTDQATFHVYHWRRGLAGKALGSCSVAVKDQANAAPRWHRLQNEHGRAVGELKLAVRFNALERAEISQTAEVTVIADSFCHLYKLDFASQSAVSSYIKGMRLPIAKRLANLKDEPPPWRPPEEDLDLMTGDADISLRSDVGNPRGFGAYIAETFARRGNRDSLSADADGRNNHGSRHGPQINGPTSAMSSRARAHPREGGGEGGRHSVCVAKYDPLAELPEEHAPSASAAPYPQV